MFAGKTSRLAELKDLLPARAVEILEELLGNPTQDLSHYGCVTFGAHGQDVRSGGAAMILSQESDALLKGRALGGHRWCTVCDDFMDGGNPYYWKRTQDPDTLLWTYWTKGQECDRQGRNAAGTRFDVRLVLSGNPQSSLRPDLWLGDVLPYTFDIDGVRVSPCTAKISGDSPSVDVVICEPYRRGDYICFLQKRLTLPPETIVTSLPETCVYLCCDSSSSSNGGGGAVAPMYFSTPVGDPQSLSAWEARKRRYACRACRHFDDASPGCGLQKPCDRAAMWGAMLRSGASRCPKNLW